MAQQVFSRIEDDNTAITVTDNLCAVHDAPRGFGCVAVLHHSYGAYWSVQCADSAGLTPLRHAVPDDYGTLRTVPCPYA